MATPNYGYEKRQRELAKKRKKEEKARAKAARKAGLDPEAEANDADGQAGFQSDPVPRAGGDAED